MTRALVWLAVGLAAWCALATSADAHRCRSERDCRVHGWAWHGGGRHQHATERKVMPSDRSNASTHETRPRPATVPNGAVPLSAAKPVPALDADVENGDPSWRWVEADRFVFQLRR